MTLYHMIVLKTHDPYLVNYENIKWISVEKHHIVGHLIRTPLNSQSSSSEIGSLENVTAKRSQRRHDSKI